MALLNSKDCDFVIYSSISHSIRIINVSFDKKCVEDLVSKLKKKYFEKCCEKYVEIQEFLNHMKCDYYS